jgi:hypothetical protein
MGTLNSVERGFEVGSLVSYLAHSGLLTTSFFGIWHAYMQLSLNLCHPISHTAPPWKLSHNTHLTVKILTMATDITLFDEMHAKIRNFDQFADLQYLTHPIHLHWIRNLIGLSTEHSLRTENTVERLIDVVQGLSRRVQRLESVLMHHV